MKKENSTSLSETLSNDNSLPKNEQGLTTAEAQKIRKQYGFNQIDSQKGKHPLMIFLTQFNNIMVYMLVVAVGLSFWFEEYVDGIAILLVILINALIGFWMELQAAHSMNALKKMVSVPAKVFRDGILKELPSKEIVPGDVLFLETGDMICADAQVIYSSELKVNESTLTGEAMPIEKNEKEIAKDSSLADKSNMLHKGTYVTNGNGKGLVLTTGMDTEFGKIAGMVNAAKEAITPLEKKLNVFSRKLIYLTIILVILIFVVGLLQGGDYIELLKTAISLAVAAIPEGLPIVATLALAQGMMKMAEHHVIVKKLSAVETLGGTTVICTDKTGTLTKNKIEVTKVIPADEDSEKNTTLLQQIAILCNTASIQDDGIDTNEIGDPLEIGLLKYAQKNGSNIEEIRKKFPEIKEIPFSSETKIMATMHQQEQGFIVFAKGADEELFKRCTSIMKGSNLIPFDDATKEAWKTISEELAVSGLRVIAGAYKEVSSENTSLTDDLVFVGLYGMTDPPAEGVCDAVEECKQAGIHVVMITGDHPATANYIAHQLHIGDENSQTLLGKDMRPYEELTETDKQQWLNTTVFARVTANQKLDLVTLLQEKGNIVGMTGDGVNDAPALKKADIGISMGTRGTQVAQEVSDMVLKDDAFSSIVRAIKQGRIIFGNIQKFIIYLLSCNLSELLIVSIVAFSGLPFQLVPLQILFINLVTDVLPALALGVSTGDPFVMKQKPRNPAEPLLKPKQWYAVWAYAIVISICTLGAVAISYFYLHLGTSLDPKFCNNILFFTLISCQLFHVFSMGSVKTSFFKTGVFRNKYVWYAQLSCILIIVAVIFVEPIHNTLNIQHLMLADWGLILGASVSSLLIIQFLKRTKIVCDED